MAIRNTVRMHRKELFMRVVKAQLSVLPVVFFALSFAFAQTPNKPNFSGKWKLNTAKSDFGGGPALPDLAVEVRHKDPEMLLTQTVQGQSLEFKLGTDGKEYSNETPDGTMKTTMRWDGDALAVVSDYAGNATFKDRWWIEDKGRTMRLTRHISGANGEADWSLVLDKVDEKK
jgi:hypothetical protein